MNVLVVNAGSSSLKLRVVSHDDSVLASATVDPWEGEHDIEPIAAFAREAPPAGAVGHRVVHGGERFTSAVVLDDGVVDALAELTPLAPLHQPRALAGIRAVRSAGAFGTTPEVACFDTSFHATIPPAAATYALPAEWRERWALRRYGFHGLSHAYAARRAAAIAGCALDDARIVTCHLGAGASLCAVRAGLSVDTTMGFTPVEGLVMATRSGSVDPGLVVWLVEHGGLPIDEVGDGLEHRSGLRGLAGTAAATGDMRDVVAGVDAGDETCRLAFGVYTHRLRREIAAMAAALGGLDVLAFTGGVGEHHPRVRQATAAGLAFLGVEIDEAANRAAGSDADITAPGGSVRTVVVTAGEEIEIARQVRSVLGDVAGGGATG